MKYLIITLLLVIGAHQAQAYKSTYCNLDEEAVILKVINTDSNTYGVLEVLMESGEILKGFYQMKIENKIYSKKARGHKSSKTKTYKANAIDSKFGQKLIPENFPKSFDFSTTKSGSHSKPIHKYSMKLKLGNQKINLTKKSTCKF